MSYTPLQSQTGKPPRRFHRRTASNCRALNTTDGLVSVTARAWRLSFPLLPVPKSNDVQ
jgi:hypothetical protein